MNANVGTVDRVLRFVVGTALIVWGVTSGNWLGAIGIVPILTATIRWCPAYCPLGISTAGSGSACNVGKKPE